MEPLNHVQLIEAFLQRQRIIGRTVEGHGYPQVDVEVLNVTADLVTVRSSWGGVMHVGPNASWIRYYAYDVRKLEPVKFRPLPPPPQADPRLAEINTSFTFPKLKPKPNPKPSRFPQVTHLTSPTLLECRVLTGNWISAIFKRLFGTHPIDVECSIKNFGHRNSYVTFELHTEHGNDLFIRLRPEDAKALAANINEGEAR